MKKSDLPNMVNFKMRTSAIIPSVTTVAAAALLLVVIRVSASAGTGRADSDVSLNGLWEMGIDRHYTNQTSVPGDAEDPAKMSPGTLWYRRTVQLPGIGQRPPSG